MATKKKPVEETEQAVKDLKFGRNPRAVSNAADTVLDYLEAFNKDPDVESSNIDALAGDFAIVGKMRELQEALGVRFGG